MDVLEPVVPLPGVPCSEPASADFFDPPAALALGPDRRLHAWLREAAATWEPLELSTRSAEYFYVSRHQPPVADWPNDLGQIEPAARALADLSVTGRTAYTRFRSLAGTTCCFTSTGTAPGSRSRWLSCRASTIPKTLSITVISHMSRSAACPSP